ncbi:hypothetical protein N7539_004103 [Penicillium diatomitis]|uniref:Xylanolytic transcriptional activator regulatory domain-containing protein n=1 Tax=Penicillium diatomitis TaxID=2819901 RepID=A0A9W9XDU6_9EURO|nr:uncharacterized protein N7539_004103 [Penicillium diatomitis]KAJ5489213.1 hypothetical protein N7539_004103 [Penicillium diatomitis]
MFLNEVNRTYESVIDPSFQSKYNAWCEIRESRSDDLRRSALGDDADVDFGILVLRVCLLSIQSLPDANYPTTGILSTHLNQVENWFCALAAELEALRPPEEPPSIVAVQHRLCHVSYLVDYAKISASWSTLNKAIQDARAIGLHLRDPGITLSDFEMELRRQAFWNLYIWDRYMCVYFNFWPLIPEGYFDVEIPRDLLQPLAGTPGAITVYTDRIYHIKIARYITAFTSPPSWHSDRYNASTVADFAQQFQALVIDPLHPTYALETPDLRWDAIEPAIPRKREFLYLALRHAQASLYRAFADAFNCLHMATKTPPKHVPSMLAFRHRRTYMDTLCKTVTCLSQLYSSTTDASSAAESLFLLPAWLMDALACLGVCLLSIQAEQRQLARQGVRIHVDHDLRLDLVTFLNTFDILRLESSSSVFLKRGLEALEGLYQIIYHSPCRELLLKSNDESETATLGAFSVRQSQGTEMELERALMSLPVPLPDPNPPTEEVVRLPEWLPRFLEKPDRSWIFRDKSFYGDLLS